MLDGPLSRKEAIWLACKPKTCCYAATVIPTGRDVWRIAHALQAPPWSFVRYFETTQPRPDAFALDRSERRYRLVLAKQPSRRKKTPAPCIFLMRTLGRHHRCGLGDLRPLSCQAFPSDLTRGGVLCLKPTGCTCRDWSLSDVDLALERALVEARHREGDEYAGVVQQWNERLVAAPDDATVDFFAFCEHLLTVYDTLDDAEAAGA